MKAILVIDKPKTCTHCPCYCYLNSLTTLDGQKWHHWCKAFVSGEDDGFVSENRGLMTDEEALEKKPSWCPLKPFPLKRKSVATWLDEDKEKVRTHELTEYDKGWNDCVEYLEGKENG